MTANVRWHKRQARKRREQETHTCYVCGRTAQKGFVFRRGKWVCWSVPLCTERVLNPPPPPPPSRAVGDAFPLGSVSVNLRAYGVIGEQMVGVADQIAATLVPTMESVGEAFKSIADELEGSSSKHD